MSLVSRLTGADKPIKQDVFWAGLMEWYYGNVTKEQIVAYFQLTDHEEAELEWLAQKFIGTDMNKREFIERLKGIMVLARDRVPGYSTVDDVVQKIQSID